MATLEDPGTDENPDAEPVEPIEGDDADAEEEEEETQTVARAAAKDGSAETQRKLDAANDKYIAAVQKIVKDEIPIVGCDHCQGRGFLMGNEAIGPQPVHPENMVECEACNGYGEVITGSRHPQHITALCIECSGSGYKTLPKNQPQNIAYMPQTVTPQAAQFGQLLPDGRFLPAGATEPITLSATS